MNGTGIRFSNCAVALALLAALAAPGALANVARVEFSVGDVSAVDVNGERRRIGKGSTLAPGDTVLTGAGRAQIRFSDGGYTSLQPGTEFRIDEYAYDARDEESSRSFFSLLRGGLRTITGAIGKINKKTYQIRTPVATIGIRGTEYLASLGDSLTVHVGAGEIEVCSQASCADFGSHQTGYVPGPDSQPVEVDAPPTLTPPQEHENYAFNGGYQGAPDAGSSYSRNDDVGSDGTTDVLQAGLANGPLYALAVSSAGIDSVTHHFATGTLGSSATLVDAAFDASGGLVEYTAPGSAQTPTGARLGAQLADVGSAAGVIGWGRWTNGAVRTGTAGPDSEDLTYFGTQSHHYVVGIPTADMPGGSATYSMIGATSPTTTSGSGAPGVVDSASLTANFDLAQVSLSMNLAVNGTPYAVSAPSMPIGTPDSFRFGGTGTASNGVDCVSVGCATAVDGYFAGPGASHAGIGYKISASEDITGAVAFRKN